MINAFKIGTLILFFYSAIAMLSAIFLSGIWKVPINLWYFFGHLLLLIYSILAIYYIEKGEK
jgi:hypothetical protein